MENNDQLFVAGGLVSPVMFLGRLNTKIKSDLCRFIRLLQFVYLRWEYSLTLAYYNKCRYIDSMINYTDKTVKTNIRLRADLHFEFSCTVLRELDQSIASEPQDAVGRCQQRPILRARTARVRYGYPGCRRLPTESPVASLSARQLLRVSGKLARIYSWLSGCPVRPGDRWACPSLNSAASECWHPECGCGGVGGDVGVWVVGGGVNNGSCSVDISTT